MQSLRGATGRLRGHEACSGPLQLGLQRWQCRAFASEAPPPPPGTSEDEQPPSAFATIGLMGFGAVGAVGVAALGVLAVFQIANFVASGTGRSIMAADAQRQQQRAQQDPPSKASPA